MELIGIGFASLLGRIDRNALPKHFPEQTIVFD